MKAKLFFLVFSIIVCFTFIQCKTGSLKQKDYRKYYLEIYKADSLYMIGNYKNSFNILDSLFKEYEPINAPPYYEYETYLKVSYLSKKNIPKKNVKSLISHYGFDTNTYGKQTYPVLKQVFEESNIAKKRYKKYREKYLNKIDTLLRQEVLKLIYLDQKARKDTSEEIRAKLMDSIDSEVEKFLIDVFSSNIYPNEHVIGNHTIDKNRAISITILLLHTRDSIRMNYFVPKLNSFVKEGECLPSTYCKIIDQYQLYNDKEQIYGTINFNQLNPKDYHSVRKNAGLPSLEYIQWKYKRILEGY